MSTLKSKKTETSPMASRNAVRKDQRFVIEINPKNWESLECFMSKRNLKAENKRPNRTKPSASSLSRPEPQKCSTSLPKEPEVEVFVEAPKHDTKERSREKRHKESSNSPDISKLLMDEVIHEIVKKGVSSRWREEEPSQPRKPEEPCCQVDQAPQELRRIWQKHNRSHLSTDYSLYNSTAYLIPPLQHQLSYSSFSNSYNNSFNNSFTYSSDDQQHLYPEFYDGKNDPVTRRLFEINYNNIEKDGRTTVMIKNIPNKYSLKLLSDEIDQDHSNTYDFLYLPFDYNNNCNVGYAFINFLKADYIKDFYEHFNGKKWSKFKSLKICVLTYARLQGRQSLIEHFYHSKVLNQKEKRYRPIIKDTAQLETLLEKQRQNQRN